MKKALSILLIACLTLSCLVACGDDEKSKATKKPGKATASAAATATATATVTDEVTAAPTDEVTVTPTNTWSPDINDHLDYGFQFDFRGGTAAWINGEGGFEWVLDNSMKDCVMAPVEGAARFTATGGDPHVVIPNFNTTFQLAEYPVVKIVMKNHTDIDRFDFCPYLTHTSAEGDPEYDPNWYWGQAIWVNPISTNDTEFQTYIIDLSDISDADDALYGPTNSAEFNLDKTVNGLRFSPVFSDDGAPNYNANVPVDSMVDIAYIGFFATVEDAEAAL